MFIGIFWLSWLNNLIVPAIIYCYKFDGFFKERPAGLQGVNGWGVLMDGFLAGLINILVWKILLEIKPIIVSQEVFIALSAGILVSFITHVYMARRMKNLWIMPAPWQWNAGGYWHMFSMSVQTAFLVYPLIQLSKNLALFKTGKILIPFILIVISGALFIVSYYQGKKGLKIGRFHINKEAW